MTEFDALLFVLSAAVLPIAAIVIAHFVLWDLDRALAKPDPKRGGRSGSN